MVDVSVEKIGVTEAEAVLLSDGRVVPVPRGAVELATGVGVVVPPKGLRDTVMLMLTSGGVKPDG